MWPGCWPNSFWPRFGHGKELSGQWVKAWNGALSEQNQNYLICRETTIVDRETYNGWSQSFTSFFSEQEKNKQNQIRVCQAHLNFCYICIFTRMSVSTTPCTSNVYAIEYQPLSTSIQLFRKLHFPHDFTRISPTLRTKPFPFWLACKSNTVKMEPLYCTPIIITTNHFTVWYLLTQTIQWLIRVNRGINRGLFFIFLRLPLLLFLWKFLFLE